VDPIIGRDAMSRKGPLRCRRHSDRPPQGAAPMEAIVVSDDRRRPDEATRMEERALLGHA
jgi:hypothetical protein